MRRVAIAGVLTLLAGGLVACSEDAARPQIPSADPAVEALAAGLSAGDLGDIPMSDPAAPAALRKVLADVEDVERSVVVADVEQQDPAGDESGGDDNMPTATGRLTWSWTIGSEVWTYDTTAQLIYGDDTWTTSWEPGLVEPSLSKRETLDLTTLGTSRGDILGAGGKPLVTERDVTKFGVDRSQVPAARAGRSARELARLVGVDVAPYVAQVEAAGEKAFVEAITYRVADVPVEVGAAYDDIPGVIAVRTSVPLAPTADFAAPILGRVGPVTAEIMDDNPGVYQIGDQVGLSGLQARYDDHLRGTPGLAVEAVSSDGKSRELFRSAAVDGKPLRLTMDLRLQRLAESALAGVGPASALVAIRPSDGAILAAANGVGTGGVNIATYGQAAPGSTYKIVSTLALLRAGLNPGSPVDCPSSVVVDGKTFGNYSDYPPSGLGRIDLATALANSCNTAFISSRGMLDDDSLIDAAASLGFGIDHDLGFPAYFGQITPPVTETEAAADLIGQGTVLASPMVMATVMASVQAGETVVPRLVESVKVSVPDGATPLSPTEATPLRQMLRGVVTGGSGAGLADVPGPPVLAKTGTAEFDRDGKRLTHAWMVAAQGDLAVAVFVDEGASGSRTAGPILEQFLRSSRVRSG